MRVGVSGGADSMALLVLACAAGCEVTAVHVDHGLRDGSAGEARVVAAAADRFGARFESRSVHIEAGANLEARARRARRQALGAAAMTGHTADDRAETMLLNLMRGSGAAGLAALGPSPTRPLLDLRRHETAELCAQSAIEVVHDPSNDDPRFRRNRVRAELIPLLASIAERDVVPLLVRTGEHLGGVNQAVRTLAEELDPTDAVALRNAPDAIGGEAVRTWLRTVGGPERHPPDAATVRRVLAVARGEARATDVGGGRRVRRTRGRLILE